MNVNYDDVIVFKALAAGYYSLVIGRVSEYAYNDHLEVENHKVFYSPSPNAEKCSSKSEREAYYNSISSSHRVGYNDIKKVVPEKYLNKPETILEDYPELLI